MYNYRLKGWSGRLCNNLIQLTDAIYLAKKEGGSFELKLQHSLVRNFSIKFNGTNPLPRKIYDMPFYNREISLKTGVADLTGQLNILELNYIIKNCLLFIGLDNFLSHLSYASKRPSIIIFGSTSPKLRAPKITKKTFFLNSNKNICKHYPCFNSVDYKGCVNNIEYKCIKSIKVSSLENLINKLDL